MPQNLAILGFRWSASPPIDRIFFAGFKYLYEGIISFKVPKAASSDGPFTDWNRHYCFVILATLASGVMGSGNITFFGVLHKFCWSVSKDPNPRYIGQSFTPWVKSYWPLDPMYPWFRSGIRLPFCCSSVRFSDPIYPEYKQVNAAPGGHILETWEPKPLPSHRRSWSGSNCTC
jgi:hypothetical protein